MVVARAQKVFCSCVVGCYALRLTAALARGRLVEAGGLSCCEGLAKPEARFTFRPSFGDGSTPYSTVRMRRSVWLS
jgi:hypothetical protein